MWSCALKLRVAFDPRLVGRRDDLLVPSFDQIDLAVLVGGEDGLIGADQVNDLLPVRRRRSAVVWVVGKDDFPPLVPRFEHEGTTRDRGLRLQRPVVAVLLDDVLRHDVDIGRDQTEERSWLGGRDRQRQFVERLDPDLIDGHVARVRLGEVLDRAVVEGDVERGLRIGHTPHGVGIILGGDRGSVAPGHPGTQMEGPGERVIGDIP